LKEVKRLNRKKKRKGVPNLNRKFMTVAEALGDSPGLRELYSSGKYSY